MTFESVMHYGPTAFTNGLGDSLDPLPQYEKYYHKIGNLALSIGDRAAVSNLYGAPLTPLSNIVTNTADGGFGSLRAAIYYANDHPGTTIQFDIPASDPGYSNGVFTIYLLGELPPLVNAGTVIDGSTQPGYGDHPVIALDGSQVSPEAFATSGLHLYGTNCTVRALAFGNFSYAGLQLFCSDAVSNHVEGCYFGLEPDGASAAPNNYAGAIFEFGARNNFIGGPNAAQRNIISGNVYYGILVNDTNSDGNVILGNYIGLDASGSFAVPNDYSGIGIYYDQRNTVIGGANAGAGNVISGNVTYGVFISDTNTSGNVVEGNIIGADITGTNALGNGFANVELQAGATGNFIGVIGAGNAIAFSGSGPGVLMYDSSTTHNSVRGNSIYSSGALGIDLNDDGITLNHTGFLAGPNDLQNYPVITNAIGSAASTIVSGTLNSLANCAFFIDIYRNSVTNFSGHGEGKFYVGTVSVTTDGSGDAGFSFTNDTGNYAGQYFTATATSAGGDTSEFGADVPAINVSAPSAQFIGPFQSGAGGFAFSLTLQTNFSYRIQATTNLGTHPISWIDLTNFTPANSSLIFTDHTAANFPVRFYRVVSP